MPLLIVVHEVMANCCIIISSYNVSDIVECDTFNGGCAHICNNVAGSFFCTCNTGFVLSGQFGCDGKIFPPSRESYCKRK